MLLPRPEASSESRPRPYKSLLAVPPRKFELDGSDERPDCSPWDACGGPDVCSRGMCAPPDVPDDVCKTCIRRLTLCSIWWL